MKIHLVTFKCKLPYMLLILITMHTTSCATSDIVVKPSNATEPSIASFRQSNDRSHENVSYVMSKNRNLFDSLHQQFSSLIGKIVFEFVVDPAGNISAINILSSELDNTLFENAIMEKIRFINFGKGEVKSVTVTFPIHFPIKL